ncbi:aldo/keto reductase [Ktedonobacter racemifer]|uniref:Aldo/keto reductase n=1 Tax=Ktedonobacter racemifer DSM 44963 TaxID=485913 RepID=D6TSD6_KTERA|nr:aldo/keto reductase [Ktedonobacter racemifer]EFH83337.1 aldo/keto reductase [Ktedonobacter racemifer DSM 44963]
MKIKRMGRTGLHVSEICLGTMTFGNQCDEPTSRAIMQKAFDAGVTFFDTADAYPLGASLETVGRTEEYIGGWLKGRREQIVLATKFFGKMGQGPNEQGGSRKHIVQAVEASLRRLQTDYIDLYQMHSPDPETPLDETLRALDDLVHSGKVLYIGCSNYPAWLLTKALWTSDKWGLARFDCVQPRYNLLFRHIEAELFPLALDQGIGVISYNPLAGGVLTGRYQPGQQPSEGTRFTLNNAGKLYQARYWQDAQMQAVERLKKFCQERNLSVAQLALAWVLSQPAITSAIVGASKPEQLDQTLPAVDLVLDEQMLEVCDDVWYQLPRERNRDVAFR